MQLGECGRKSYLQATKLQPINAAKAGGIMNAKRWQREGRLAKTFGYHRPSYQLKEILIKCRRKRCGNMQRVERSREPIRCRRAWGHYFSIQYDCRLAGHAIRLNLSQCCHMEPAKSRRLTTNQDSKMILSRSRSRNRNRNRCLMKLSSASTALNTVF